MILYFSGTGNSRWVALRLASLLGDKAFDITAKLPKHIAVEQMNVSTNLIWVFPIHSWGLPLVVKRFIKEWEGAIAQDSQHYMVCTCGDDIGLAHKQWLKTIKNRRWNGGSMFSIQMPNTYTLMKGFDVDNPEIAQQKLAAATARVEYIVQQIKADRLKPTNITDVTKGRCAWIKTRIIYPLFMKFCMSTKPFHATHNCIGCGRCERECPLQNISMIDNRPHWSNDCTMCLRCYHICPQHAVAYGKATRYKGQYTYPNNG